MAGEFITAGTSLRYGIAPVAAGVATKPVFWNTIPNITSTPDLNASPDTVDVTDLSDLVYKRSIQGLIDLSMLEFEANYTAALVTAVAAAAADPVDPTATWVAETAYSLGDTLVEGSTSSFYICTTAGTSGTVEPTWATSGVIDDGTTVKWTFMSLATAGLARAFCIEFPGTSERVWWIGSVSAAMPAGAAVGEAQTTTIAISVESDFAKVAL